MTKAPRSEDSLCWSCRNATPGKCSWVASAIEGRVPDHVQGFTEKAVTVNGKSADGGKATVRIVTDCTRYKSGALPSLVPVGSDEPFRALAAAILIQAHTDYPAYETANACTVCGHSWTVKEAAQACPKCTANGVAAEVSARRRHLYRADVERFTSSGWSAAL